MTAVAKGLGNAVPPKLAEAIAHAVADHLDQHASEAEPARRAA